MQLPSIHFNMVEATPLHALGRYCLSKYPRNPVVPVDMIGVSIERGFRQTGEL